MSDIRYQVFVSSTYSDLKEHRQAVQKALLSVEAIPAGMELFPASDDDAWTLIRKAIDDSDYYVVIIGGRYGSVDGSGKSFTEREFDYAVGKNIPVMCFLHSDMSELPRNQTEIEPEAWDKLIAFQAKAKQRHCKYWRTVDELAAAVMQGFHLITKKNRAIGWVRGDQAKTIADVERMSMLQEQVRELEAQQTSSPPDGSDAFAQGEEIVAVEAYVTNRNDKIASLESAAFRWDQVFLVCARATMSDGIEHDIRSALSRVLRERLRADEGKTVQVADRSFELIRTQFIALNLIELELLIRDRVPSKSDSRDIVMRMLGPQKTNVWRLTRKGYSHFARLSAIRRGDIIPPHQPI